MEQWLLLRQFLLIKMASTVGSEDRLTSGHRLSHPAPGDEVVITGISGAFPDSDSVIQLQEGLFNKVDFISSESCRWKFDYFNIPRCIGRINNVDKFDASFFGIHFKQAHPMDPMSRIFLEKTYEAIIDAGVNPNELRNTKTGVFIGACMAESERIWCYDKMHVDIHGAILYSRSMLAHNISQWLGLIGPSYTLDSACSSSLYALEHAFRAIRNGQCDAAIVGGINLSLHPAISLQFVRLGSLSPDGRCKSFDNSANGYVRSEAIVACFLQKAKDSRRVYAQIIYAKTNCDGYKEQSIYCPSSSVQKLLFTEFYEECSIPPSSVEFIEAHGTGTVVGDPIELEAIEDVFCTGRSEPLLVGSVKSNLGHTEHASGITSIAKLCIAYNTGYIAPNIHYKVPREGIKALVNGKIKVVTEKNPWNGGAFGINNFGFGGANAHTLFKNIARSKVNNGLPSDDLPRLVCVSGRTKSAVARILDDLGSRTVDVEFVRLLHAIHDKDITGHIYRGYILLESTSTKSVSLARNIQSYSGARRPVCFVYSGLGSQWAGMATQLMRIPVFAAAIETCHKTLEPKGINLTKIITDPDPKIFDNILNSFIGIAAVQIGLTDVLKAVGIEPDFVIGQSVGESGCSYADGCFTTEQAILAAYSLGLASIEIPLIAESMAVVGLGHDEIKKIIPPEIEVACHNGPGSSTISGPADKIKICVAELVVQEIFAEEIPCSNIAYHSRYISEAGTKLLKSLKKVISTPRPRSNRWLSTSVQKTLRKDSNAEMSSAEYLTNNFLNPVPFEETARLIPENAITIEVAPRGLLEAILRQSLKKEVINVPLTEWKHMDNVQVLFTALGKLYEVGLNPHLANIYPAVQFPVSQGTPMLSHLVEWEHSESWYVALYETCDKITTHERTIKMSISDDGSDFMTGHLIDGRNLYPATGYLVMVWETFAMMLGQMFTNVSVIFENLRFHRATIIPKDGELEFIVMIQKGDGHFEIVESGASIVTGRIYAKKNVAQDYRMLPEEPELTGPNVKHILKKDFYKELRLRGYQYSGLFRGVIGCNAEGTRGRLAWVSNWVTFFDCMMQMKIIGDDTRGLFVPTGIEKLSIDAEMQYDAISKMTADPTKRSFEIRIYPNINIIRSGGVEIRGVQGSMIAKRIPLYKPLLEKNVFVPNIGKSTWKVEDILNSNIQIFLENIRMNKVEIIEIVDVEYKNNALEPIIDKVADVLRSHPLIQANLIVLSEESIEMPTNISVENKNLNEITNALLVIGANLLGRPKVMKQVLSGIRDKGFIISREIRLINPKDFSDKYDIIRIQNTGLEYLVLFRKRVGSKPANIVKITSSDDTYAWIDKVKEALNVGRKLLVYSQDEQVNGLLGLVNCLRKEPGGEIVHGLLIADSSAPPFDPDLEFYEEQLNMDLAINVYQEGQWGTYRHLLLDDYKIVPVHHAFMNTINIGDLSSMSWLEGPIRKNEIVKDPDNVLVHVYCASLNFRDVMMAMGRLTLDTRARGHLAQECVQGFEIVGRTQNGSRVMAMVKNSGMANMVMVDRTLLWSMPDEWTFEEAATVPVVYATVYHALVMVGKIQKGESILIHVGSGGVGQAAINVALHYGAEVFTTVGNPVKRAFIKKLFPQLKDSHIGNSRDTSFENMIMKETNGKGVDLVLNSLADDKLQASVRCLGYRGRFLEIGRVDINNNTPISMDYFLKEISFHGIMLGSIFYETMEFKKTLQDLLISGIQSGVVRPLSYCTFGKDQVEAAFRYIAGGKHIGKVIIKIRDEERGSYLAKPSSLPINALPRYRCNPQRVYILVGGLGGFGLELADWLILRGARKVLLISRRGVSDGYQSLRLRVWASCGVNVQISTHDVTTKEGCEQMLKMANDMGTVEAIFNLAVILKDYIFQNQTPETFKLTFAPKVSVTMNLDKLSQKLCPDLKDFVVFSSASCGRGNAGQTNYGFSNSMIERICERRKQLGLPALAIQWGAIGDVGVLADTQGEDIQLEIGGTLQQAISSCLVTLDKFLKQEAVIVSSIVIAKKKAARSICGGVVETVTQIMGIMDLKTVSQQVSLADLGMDSMIALEIKQTLEKNFEIFLTAQDIRNLTLGRLVELAAQREVKKSSTSSVYQITKENSSGFHIIRDFGDETMACEPFVYLPTLVNDGTETDADAHENETIMFMLPGLDGCAAGMAPLCRKLKIKVCVLQYAYEQRDYSLDNLVNRLYKIIKSRLNPGSPYILLGYSFGSLPALRLAEILESEGYSGTVFCLDGSPNFIYNWFTSYMPVKTNEEIQNNLIYYCMSAMATISDDVPVSVMDKLKDIESYDERIQYAIKMYPVNKTYSNKFLESMMKSGFDRLKMILNQPEIKVRAPVVLLRPKDNLLAIEENYDLDKVTEGPVFTHLLEGDHGSIIASKDCADIINRVLTGYSRGKIGQNAV